MKPAAALALALLSAPARADKLDSSNKRATTVCVKPDRDLVYRREPGCSAEVSRAGRKALMSYNALGLRDKDYPPEAPAGATRLLVMGGSLMTAPGLEEKDAPPRALERALRAKGLSVEVVNGAGEGFTGWQNAVILPELLEAYAPKAVVYHLASHYIFTDRALWYDLRVGPKGVRGRFPALRSLPKELRPLFRGAPRVQFMIRTWREQWGRIKASRAVAKAPPAQGFEDLMAPTLAELRQMAAACRKAGARFYVVYDGDAATADQYLLVGGPAWPGKLAQSFWIRSLRFEGATVEDRLRVDGAAFGYELLSIAAERTKLQEQANRLPGDYHWNERGSALFGEAAAAALAPALSGRTASRAP